MDDRKGEGFHLIDLIILVAATGMGSSYAVQGEPWRILTYPTNPIFWSMYHRNLAITVHTLWLSWTVAWLVMGLRRLGTASRRSRRGPVWVACMLAPIGVACHWLEAAVVQYRMETWRPSQGIPYTWIWHMADTPSLLIAGAWFALWWCGRWRVERSAFDRVGCILGSGWLAFGLANRIFNVLGVF